MLSVHLGYVYKISLEQLTVLRWRHAQGGKLEGVMFRIVLRGTTEENGRLVNMVYGTSMDKVLKMLLIFILLFKSKSNLVYTGRKSNWMSQKTHQARPVPVSALHWGICLAVAALGRRPSIRKSTCIKSKRQRLSDKTHYHFIICCMTSQISLPPHSLLSPDWTAFSFNLDLSSNAAPKYL